MIPATTLHELYWVRKMSQEDIGRRLGVKKQTVRGWMVRYGIKARTKRDAAILGPSEWTEDRIKQLKVLWFTKLTTAQIRDELGVSYGPRAISAKAHALGLPKRSEHSPRTVRHIQPEPVAHAKDERRMLTFPERPLISFLPNRRLELMWLTALAEVRAKRGRAEGHPEMARPGSYQRILGAA